MFAADRLAPASVTLRGARRASRRVRARAGTAGVSPVCIASGADASCSTPVGWKGDQLRHSSLPLLPDGALVACCRAVCCCVHQFVMILNAVPGCAGKPDYASIDSQVHSKVLTATIRKLLIREVGGKDKDPRPWTNFEALMTPVRRDMTVYTFITTADCSGACLSHASRLQGSQRHGWLGSRRPAARKARLHGDSAGARCGAPLFCPSRRDEQLLFPPAAPTCASVACPLGWRQAVAPLTPTAGIGWVPPIWKAAIQPNIPQWASSFSFYLVFATLFPWLMGPIKGEDYVDVEARLPTGPSRPESSCRRSPSTAYLRFCRTEQPPPALPSPPPSPHQRTPRNSTRTINPTAARPQVPENLRKVFPFLPASVSLPQAIKAERCRFLETSQCASVCVNSCKVPSQEWLGADFNMPLHIQPNYEDYSCTWRFNTPPPPLEEDQAILVPCFALCPSDFKARDDAPLALWRCCGALVLALLRSCLCWSCEGEGFNESSLYGMQQPTRRELQRPDTCWVVGIAKEAPLRASLRRPLSSVACRARRTPSSRSSRRRLVRSPQSPLCAPTSCPDRRTVAWRRVRLPSLAMSIANDVFCFSHSAQCRSRESGEHRFARFARGPARCRRARRGCEQRREVLVDRHGARQGCGGDADAWAGWSTGGAVSWLGGALCLAVGGESICSKI